MHEAISSKRFLFILGLLVSLLVGCTNGTDPDDEGEAGVIGTGLILRGTVTDVREFASNSLQIKARSGEVSKATIDDTGRYRASSVKGAPPYVLRVDLGNDEYRYGIAFDNERANVHSYSDATLRNWFGFSNGDIDFEFTQELILTTLPSRTQFQNVAAEILGLVKLVVESYKLSDVSLLTADYDSTGSDGIDNFLRNNPVLIQDEVISLVITDPDTKTQSTTRTGFSLFELADEPDTQSPETPMSVRALASASNEVVVVWEPSFDNRGVAGYEVFRDGVLVATTPFPVFIDTPLESNTLYTYEVAAIDSSQNTSATSVPATTGTLEEPDTIAPPAPIQLAVASVLGRMDLIWGQTNIGDVVSFEVYRGRGNGPIDFLTSVTSSVMTDLKVSSGIEYCYQIAAVDASGNESEKSNEVCQMAKGDEILRQSNQAVSPVPALAGLSIPDLEFTDCSVRWEAYAIESSLTVDSGCYLVDQSIEIKDGGALSLKSGVVLKFGSGVGVKVNMGGSFTTDGTKVAPVILTAKDPTPGYWAGIEYKNSNSARNKLVNTVLEYAGGGSSRSAIYLNSTSSTISRAEISSSVIRNCVGAGIRAVGDFSNLHRVDGTVISDCDIPLVVDITQLGGVTQRNDFTQNTNAVVDIGEADVSFDLQIKDIGVPYLLTNLRVLQGKLTLLEGVVIQVRSGGEIYVSSALKAVGSQSRRVKFTGSVFERGHWGGVYVSGSVALQYVDIEYAGGRYKRSNVLGGLLVSTGDVSLSSVKIVESDSFALHVSQASSELKVIDNLKLVRNVQAVRLPLALINEVGPKIDFTDNDNSRVELTNTLTHKGNVELFDIGVPYHLTDSIDEDTGNIKIYPGVILNVSDGVRIDLSNQSFFSAIGTAEKPIFIGHESNVGGSWEGITITSNNNMNRIEHAVISSAGGANHQIAAAITMECNSAAYLFVGNAVIENSDGWGIASDGANGCNLVIGDNVDFYNNRLGAVEVE